MNKKIAYLLSAALLVTAPSVTFTSCGDDDPIENGSGTKDNSTDSDSETGKLSPDAQKAKFEAVGQELLNEFSAKNFTELRDLCEHVDENLINNPDFDHSVVSKWFEEALDACTELDYTDESSDSYDDESGTHATYYTSNYYTRLYVLSNFTGHFTADKNGWTKTDADDLQFNFTDQNGNPCTLKLTTSGKTITVPIGEIEGDYSYGIDGNDYLITQDYLDEYVEVPENIELTLTQNGKTLAAASVKSDFSKIDLENLDLNNLALSTEATCEIEGYTLQVNRVAFSFETGNAEVTVSLKNGNKTLISGSITVNNVKLNLDSEDEDEDILTSDNGVNISLNILDKIRIEGVCDNIGEVVDYLQNCDANKYDETSFKANLELANELLHLGSYFDNNPTKQTDVILGAKFIETPWSSDKGYWTCEPLLKFDDNTTYSFGDYFSEDSFKPLIDSFTDLLQSFKELAK